MHFYNDVLNHMFENQTKNYQFFFIIKCLYLWPRVGMDQGFRRTLECARIWFVYLSLYLEALDWRGTNASKCLSSSTIVLMIQFRRKESLKIFCVNKWITMKVLEEVLEIGFSSSYYFLRLFNIFWYEHVELVLRFLQTILYMNWCGMNRQNLVKLAGKDSFEKARWMISNSVVDA